MNDHPYMKCPNCRLICEHERRPADMVVCSNCGADHLEQPASPSARLERVHPHQSCMVQGVLEIEGDKGIVTVTVHSKHLSDCILAQSIHFIDSIDENEGPLALSRAMEAMDLRAADNDRHADAHASAQRPALIAEITQELAARTPA